MICARVYDRIVGNHYYTQVVTQYSGSLNSNMKVTEKGVDLEKLRRSMRQSSILHFNA